MNVSVLLGKTLKRVENRDNSEIFFETDEGTVYRMYHERDCCEDVLVEDIAGELNWMVCSPILMAEEITQRGTEQEWGTSTWTFYKFATIEGYVTIRWLGTSNGYYSESVDFEQVASWNSR